MPTNNRYVKGLSHDKRFVQLNTKDLAVGDKLIRVVRTGNQWGSVGQRREEEVTVVKILKTRLVVKTNAGTEYRLVVKFSKTWDYNNGEVTTNLEGESEYARLRNSFDLYTLDDPFLAEQRLNFAALRADADLKHAIKETSEDFTKSSTVTNALAAIAALQAFVAANEEK